MTARKSSAWRSSHRTVETLQKVCHARWRQTREVKAYKMSFHVLTAARLSKQTRSRWNHGRELCVISRSRGLVTIWCCGKMIVSRTYRVTTLKKGVHLRSRHLVLARDGRSNTSKIDKCTNYRLNFNFNYLLFLRWDEKLDLGWSLPMVFDTQSWLWCSLRPLLWCWITVCHLLLMRAVKQRMGPHFTTLLRQ